MGNPQDQSAFDIIRDQLTQWGLGSLADSASTLIKQGLTGNAITIELSNTPEYQQRFAGNALRIKNGLKALAPADYVATETSYKQVLSQYGLPRGFYDSPSALNDFIAKDVSPAELNTRAQAAQQIWLSQDHEAQSTWRSFYGLSDGAAIASILDPEVAMPIVQRMANAAQWGGDAMRQGLDPDKARLEQYSDQGISSAAVLKGLQQTGIEQSAMDKLAQRFGVTYDQGTGMDANVAGNAAAVTARQNLINNEQALFSSRSAPDSAALGRNTTGQF